MFHFVILPDECQSVTRLELRTESKVMYLDIL